MSGLDISLASRKRSIDIWTYRDHKAFDPRLTTDGTQGHHLRDLADRCRFVWDGVLSSSDDVQPVVSDMVPTMIACDPDRSSIVRPHKTPEDIRKAMGGAEKALPCVEAGTIPC